MNASAPNPSAPLTLDTMRQDVARLLHEDSADIADDDNLIELGLDSMRAMALATRWREAGASLEFSAMALEPTLAAWWALVQAGQ